MRNLIVFICSIVSSTTISAAGTPEIAPAPSLPCFKGAYYRKVVSSVDHWAGIEGEITLPHADFDSSRTKAGTGRYLDNPSIYMGGSAEEHEVDCGVSWEVVRHHDGSVSKQGEAFRPFWRTKEWHSAPARPEFYYYPGDTIRMSCVTTESGKLNLTIALLSRAAKQTTGGLSPAETDITSTRSAGWHDPLSTFTTTFDAPGFGPDAMQQFKRVNAIDQSGNEGKDVQPTSTTVEGAIWWEVWLMRGDESLPMKPSRYTDMRCPDATHVQVERGSEEDTGERIRITGNPEAAK